MAPRITDTGNIVGIAHSAIPTMFVSKLVATHTVRKLITYIKSGFK